MPDNNFVNICLISGNINYFNRIIKKYDTLAEYQALGSYYTTTVNFDPGNNLQTTLVIGTSSTNALTMDCNYLLVYTTANNTDTIQQRWWVMDQKRTRGGQYTLSLKRDVIADFYDTVTEAPCFIEKATIRDFDNPLIFNKEDMDFNQIKKSETLLKDDTKMAWLVGYVARNYNGGTFTSTYDVKADYVKEDAEHTTLPFSPGRYETVNGIQLWLYASWGQPAGQPDLSKSYIEFTNSNFESYQYFYKPRETNRDGYFLYPYVVKYMENGYVPINYSGYLQSVANYIYTNRASVKSAFNTTYGYDDQEDFRSIVALNGKIYKDASVTPNKYYKIKITQDTLNVVWNVVSSSAFGVAIDAGIKKPVNDNIINLTSNYNNAGGYMKMRCEVQGLTMTLEEFTPYGYTIQMSSSRNRLNDAPYDLFCIPYPLEENKLAMVSWTNVETFTAFYISKEDSMHVAQAIAAQLGPDEFLYDLQILPYCPISNLMGTFEIGENIYEECISLIGLTGSKDYNVVLTTETSPRSVSVVFWSTVSSKTFNVYESIEINNPKIENETKMYRLVSPNYSGMFEFSPAKNGGVDYFNVDVTFKPYNPYIHINPNFKFLYGSDFNDTRGLICGGDFSIALVDDKWANFEINNKNYQLIFDREVQNMDFVRKQERIQQNLGIAAGVAQGAAQGGATGGWVGAIAGAGVSALGGAIDYTMSEQKYKESLSLKKDLYGYNLGNVAALPNGLTKSMSLNENFKFWPFLEEYDCSDIEREALVLKLKYDGMTVMKIGKISDYLAVNEETFIKGQIIRLENLPEATDVAYEIYNEIKRGVFI